MQKENRPGLLLYLLWAWVDGGICSGKLVSVQWWGTGTAVFGTDADKTALGSISYGTGIYFQ